MNVSNNLSVENLSPLPLLANKGGHIIAGRDFPRGPTTIDSASSNRCYHTFASSGILLSASGDY